MYFKTFLAIQIRFFFYFGGLGRWGWCTYIIHNWVNFLVTMKRIMINACFKVFITRIFYRRTLTCYCLFQNKNKICVFNFKWPFKGLRKLGKLLSRRPRGCRGRLIEVVGYSGFYLQCLDNNFTTLITGDLTLIMCL